ncbi:hypothetical protein [Bacillus fonticola]|uniref:hypothetical protein n=1 Tax=Bacillus fonticola TaxID=2728853 RepID=UPI001D14D0B2|nr:hypothetical protein [Bacillus fonticola]
MKGINSEFTHEVSIIVDQYTPCLEHRESGEIYPTDVSSVTREDLNQISSKYGWSKFDWAVYYNSNTCTLKKLTIKEC